MLYLIVTCKSFSKKKRGPKTEPCGTPWLICSISELCPCIDTYYDLLVRYDLYQLLATPLIP